MSKKKSGQVEFVKWFGPVLDALRDLGGSGKPREIVEWIGVHLNIPDEVLNERYAKSGQLKFPNQIGLMITTAHLPKMLLRLKKLTSNWN